MSEKAIYTGIAVIILMLSAYAIYSTINNDPYNFVNEDTAVDTRLPTDTPTKEDGWKTAKLDMPAVTVGSSRIYVTIADNNQERAQGLSGRQILHEDEGMLFLYENPTTPSFWMYNMNFPLDMIWIREGVVVDITENVPAPDPGTSRDDLPRYHPSTTVDTILEVNAGFVQENNIQIGDNVALTEGAGT